MSSSRFKLSSACSAFMNEVAMRTVTTVACCLYRKHVISPWASTSSVIIQHKQRMGGVIDYRLCNIEYYCYCSDDWWCLFNSISYTQHFKWNLIAIVVVAWMMVYGTCGLALCAYVHGESRNQHPFLVHLRRLACEPWHPPAAVRRPLGFSKADTLVTYRRKRSNMRMIRRTKLMME